MSVALDLHHSYGITIHTPSLESYFDSPSLTSFTYFAAEPELIPPTVMCLLTISSSIPMYFLSLAADNHILFLLGQFQLACS